MKIAFASCVCYDQFNKQPWWDDIKAVNPDYLFLLGDNIYMDDLDPEKLEPLKEMSPQDFTDLMSYKYKQQFDVANFKSLVESLSSRNRLHAIWDDHDFAWNNARGRENPSESDRIKFKMSQELFNIYFHPDKPNDSPIYHSFQEGDVKFIFLDNRMYAQKPGETSELLGENQWNFLINELNIPAKFNILCGGISLNMGRENWKRYPAELVKLCKLIASKNVIYLAGDIHRNEFVEPIEIKKLFPNKYIHNEFINSNSHLKTPAQFITSGFAVRPIINNRHHWALLTFEEGSIKIEYYKSDLRKATVVDRKLSDKACKWLQANFYIPPIRT